MPRMKAREGVDMALPNPGLAVLSNPHSLISRRQVGDFRRRNIWERPPPVRGRFRLALSVVAARPLLALAIGRGSLRGSCISKRRQYPLLVSLWIFANL